MGEDDAEDNVQGPSSPDMENPHDVNVYHVFDPDEGKSLLISWDGNGYDQRTHWIQADKENGVVDLSEME